MADTITAAALMRVLRTMDDEELSDHLDTVALPQCVDADKKRRLILAELRSRPLARWLVPESGEDGSQGWHWAMAEARLAVFGERP